MPKLNIKALVRDWGKRRKNHRVSRRGEIKCPCSWSIDTPGSNDLHLFLGATLRKLEPGNSIDCWHHWENHSYKGKPIDDCLWQVPPPRKQSSCCRVRFMTCIKSLLHLVHTAPVSKARRHVLHVSFISAREIHLPNGALWNFFTSMCMIFSNSRCSMIRSWLCAVH